MKILLKIFLPIACCLLPTLLFSQLLDSSTLRLARVYDNMPEALEHPNNVYRLSLRGKKLRAFPMDILKFKNLQELDLSRNKIDSLPDEIDTLISLQVLDISSNKVEAFPRTIGKLKNLKKIAAGRNEIAAIPSEICELENLEILDLWSNQIMSFPEEFHKLSKLRWMDLRAIQIEDDVQLHIKEMLPKAIIHFSPSCHCVTGG